MRGFISTVQVDGTPPSMLHSSLREVLRKGRFSLLYILLVCGVGFMGWELPFLGGWGTGSFAFADSRG